MLIDASLQGFSIFCGLGIHNCMTYEEALKLTARQKVALEVLAYHASSTIEETVEFMVIVYFVIVHFNCLTNG